MRPFIIKIPGASKLEHVSCQLNFMVMIVIYETVSVDLNFDNKPSSDIYDMGKLALEVCRRVVVVWNEREIL